MAWLEHIPALVKIFLVLGIVVFALKFKIPLYFSLLIGGAFLGFFFQMSLPEFLRAVVAGTLSLDTISVVVIVTGILSLSNAMSISGRMERIVASFKRLVGESRITLVTFPALIGFLPMPGGAVFSAPMVGAVSQNSTLLPQHKTIINYWFRHIWEYWFPLYPGVILALSLTNVPAWKFIVLNFPMTLVALGAGYLVMLRHVSLGDKKHREYSRENILNFLNQLIPIFLVVSTLLLLGIFINILERQLEFKSKLLERAPILIGITLSFLWVVIADKMDWGSVRQVFMKKAIWQLALLVIAVMVFRSILENSGGVTVLRDELLTYKIPIIGLVMALPLITGIVTGIAVGFVGTSFPVVIPLIAAMGEPWSQLYALIFLAYVFGFTGMMLSPVHLCLLLTKDYFGANLMRAYTQYLIPVSLLTSGAAVLFFLLYKLLQF